MTVRFFDKVRVVDPSSGRDEVSSVVVSDGVIADIGTPQEVGAPPSDASNGAESVVLEAGSIMAPGLVDMRVQFRTPGFAHAESRKSLLHAAAAGGITSLVCLPNTSPPLDNPDSLAALIQQDSVHEAPSPRLYAYGAATTGLEDQGMAELGLLAEAGAVGFTNATKPIADSLMMRRIMSYAAMLGKPIIQHAEDPALAKDGEMNEGEVSTRLGLRGIPAEAEEIMVARDLALMRLTGVHYHIAHISTARAVALVRQAKAEGLNVTCDTAPPYFMLNDLAVMEYDTRFRLSPPLRSESDRQAVVEALADGTIDCVASDHAPQDRDAKLLPFGVAAVGASGLETLLPLVMGLYHQGVISMGRVFELTASAPARVLNLKAGGLKAGGLQAGRLSIGAAADFTIIAPERGWKIRGGAFESFGHATSFAGATPFPQATPFQGQPVQGRVLSTWVGGALIYTP